MVKSWFMLAASFTLTFAVQRADQQQATARSAQAKRGSHAGIESQSASCCIAIASLSSSPPRGTFILKGFLFDPTSEEADKEKRFALKTLTQGAAALRVRIAQGGWKGHERIAARQLADIGTTIELLKENRLKSFEPVTVTVVPGADQPLHNVHSELVPVHIEMFRVRKPPDGQQKSFSVTLNAGLNPGPYTLILTLSDIESVPGNAIYGGSVSINVAVDNSGAFSVLDE